MPLELLGAGAATPEHSLSAEDALALAQRVCCETPRQERLAAALYRRSGVDRRATCVPHTEADNWLDTPGGPPLGQRMRWYEEHATPLALASATAALADGDVPPDAVTHLVTVSCTGFESPGVDLRLIESLGLAPTTERVHVGFMGCHGAINGLRVARGLAAADPAACILLDATELCSLHYAFGWDPERITGNALFADGSGAVVLRETPSPGEAAWRLAATGSTLLADSSHLMSWRVRDHGFEMALSAELPGLVERELAAWLRPWLASHGLAVEDVASWAVHPGGPKIVSAVENTLGLPPAETAVSREVLAEHGNMSSATVLFLLDRLRRRGARPPCVMLGFGPGIFAEVALWR